MAKYRHRVFEMFELREEAFAAIMPKAANPGQDDETSAALDLEHLEVSPFCGVMHVRFQKPQQFSEEAALSLKQDLDKLATSFAKDTKVLIDFSGLPRISGGNIEDLLHFRQKLRSKGSRLVLCCLEPDARASFFAADPPIDPV